MVRANENPADVRAGDARSRSPADSARRILHVRGVVQGVGFRPFVWRTARELGLSGAVWNDPDGVTIDVEGDRRAIARLSRTLREAPPPQARIETLEIQRAAVRGSTGFEIRASDDTAAAKEARVTPDLRVCDECLAEMRDARDRRHGYPFLNCTACGPRYSIARDVPYDRARTTMAAFAMCAECESEYRDPASRRFHAQPTACAVCGPRARLEPTPRSDARRVRHPESSADSSAAASARSDTNSSQDSARAIAGAVEALRAGELVAVKGLGGFHLACDARSVVAVRKLRARKHRPAKPLAVMFPTLADVERAAFVSPRERESLTSVRAPIVLLRRRADADVEGPLCTEIAPGLDQIGAFLPYTPLHHLLMSAFGGPLVMTSGNLSDEPIAADNADARRRLAGIADRYLDHDREIHMRVDDSVVRIDRERERVLRRARGYVPEAFDLHFDAPPVLAIGGDLENTLCLTSGNRAVMSQHIGNLASFEARTLLAETRANLERLLQVEPRAVAHDLHPGYHGTRIALASAESLGLSLVGVQHHHAHVASCLVENARHGPVIGVAWNGTGYGDDGTMWGGEFLVADLERSVRVARLHPVPMPGGNAAAREPWRMTLAHLAAAGADASAFVNAVCDRSVSQHAIRSVASMIKSGIQDERDGSVASGANTPLTSSAGRLFDAVSALLGVCTHPTYEGQAAAELEAASAPGAHPYSLPLRETDGLLELDARVLVREIASDARRGAPRAEIGGRFHAALARGIADGCAAIAERTGLRTVALTGGCFQNRLLADATVALLEQSNLEVLEHGRVPAGDGGLALGQAAIAAWRMRDVPRDSR
jgi:hydrogenase maturation protein HypF